jgi:hypothetical protein
MGMVMKKTAQNDVTGINQQAKSTGEVQKVCECGVKGCE